MPSCFAHSVGNNRSAPSTAPPHHQRNLANPVAIGSSSRLMTLNTGSNGVWVTLSKKNSKRGKRRRHVARGCRSSGSLFRVYVHRDDRNLDAARYPARMAGPCDVSTYRGQAWQAILIRIGLVGQLMDVCESTNKQP